MNTCGYSPYVTSSLIRGLVCLLQMLLALASEVILGFESCGTHDHILLSQVRDFPNLEGQVPVFISLRNMVAQLYPQPLGSLLIASYDSQGGGCIQTRWVNIVCIGLFPSNGCHLFTQLLLDIVSAYHIFIIVKWDYYNKNTFIQNFLNLSMKQYSNAI
jgi:hypothetical protein